MCIDLPKKRKKGLKMPKVHSKFNVDKLEEILTDQAIKFLSDEKREAPSFIFLSGSFFDVKGFAYSAIRAWKGAAKPTEDDSGKRPLLEATFASISVYLSSLLSLQSDFYYAYEEIKEILLEKNREDLWAIISEKLPFISLPPKEMYGNQVSPVSPYFVIRQDEDLILGEIYPSVYLTKVIKSIKTRFFVFFQYEGYTAFGFFNSLPSRKNFGFEETPKPFDEDPSPENLIRYTKNANNLKEVLIGLIHAHNNAYLEEYLIEDYEELLEILLSEMEVQGV
ncbi:MAG: hypothetical protein BAJALOKI2v1_590003 [Promethearchaeota archaeon]|nr:MAG: hypothetical protein BAJALOKI2v1_590003 [Candidatus Lokiarchaeota archaeon]